jgi:hypothetical protein
LTRKQKKRLDDEAKKKDFEKMQENKVNPNTFLMNAKVKNNDNAHLFQMDFFRIFIT